MTNEGRCAEILPELVLKGYLLVIRMVVRNWKLGIWVSEKLVSSKEKLKKGLSPQRESFERRGVCSPGYNLLITKRTLKHCFCFSAACVPLKISSQKICVNISFHLLLFSNTCEI